jgi:hypothetical protein
MRREGRTGMMDGIQLEPREDDEGEEVWYSGTIPLTTGTLSCPISVGGAGRSLMEFTNSAPVLRVDVGMRYRTIFHASLIIHSKMSIQHSSNALM